MPIVIYGYLFLSVFWLTHIELIEGEHVGYWEQRGYSNDAWVGLADRSYSKKKPDTPFRGPAFIDFIYPFLLLRIIPLHQETASLSIPPILNERDNRAKEV